MKLTYAIAFEDFKAMQPPFATRPGNNAGFRAVLIACGLMSLLGVFLLINGAGLAVGLFLIGLGMAAAIAAYFYEQRSVSAKKEKYEKKIVHNFQQIHCRDQRIFTADETGFTTVCDCGTVTRPWSELTTFSENKTHFAFNTKMGGQVLPKSAFSMAAEITEFRTLVSGKVSHDNPPASPYVDFTFRREHYRAADWLHTIKGGGWRRSAKILATSAFSTLGSVVIWRYISAPRDPIVLIGLIALLVAAPAYGMTKRRKNQKYLGSLRLYFSDEGLHAQYPAAQSRRPWNQFIGYLDNTDVFVLYLAPGFYTVVPKRALAAQTERFQSLLKTKLGKYDYRNPVASGPKLAGSGQQASR
jgi:hypothetical protein